MATVVPVDDPGDPRLSDYMSLNDAELRRQVEAADRDGPGLFIAEGLTAIARLLASPYPVRSVLVTPSRLPRLAPLIDDLDVTVFVAEPAVLQAVAGFDLHRGAVAAADRLAPRDPVDVVGDGADRRRARGPQRPREPRCHRPLAPGASASTASSSTRPAPTRSTDAACGCRWARCCTSPSPG